MNPVVKSSSPSPSSTLRARRHAGAPEPSHRDSRAPGSLTCISSRPSCRTTLRETHFPLEKVERCFHRNQQYSINAVPKGSAAVVERYAYSEYGTPTITGGSGTTIATSAISNRYTYTGREWDQALALYHYRARMYDPVAGRFVSRDPLGYTEYFLQSYQYVSSSVLTLIDPFGLYQRSPGIGDCEELYDDIVGLIAGYISDEAHDRENRNNKIRQLRRAPWNDSLRKGSQDYENERQNACSKLGKIRWLY